MNQQATVELIKAAMPTGISPMVEMRQLASNVDATDAVAWPLDQDSMLQLYISSPEHARCCQIKAEGAFGGGLKRGAAANKLEQFTDDSTNFFVELGLDLTVYGNAFVQIIRSGTRLVQLRPLPARTMYRHINGVDFMQLIYGVRGEVYRTKFDADDIIHLRQPCPAALWYALPSWYSSTGMIELYRAASAFNAAFFDNGAVPEMAIIFKGFAPDAATKQDVRDFFTANHKGIANAHRTLVTHVNEGQSVEFKELTRSPKDGDFIKLLDAAKERIPIAHGVPPRMLGIISGGQLGGGGENIGQMHTFNQFTLAPFRRRMIGQIMPAFTRLGLSDELVFNAVALVPETAATTPMQKSTDTQALAALLAKL